MKGLLITTLICLIFSSNASCDSKTKLKKIETLLEVTGYKEDYNNETDIIIKESMKRMEETAPSLIAHAKEEYLHEIEKIVHDMLAYEKMKAHLTKTYNEHFTEEEIDAIIAFNQTAVGKSIRKKSELIADAKICFFQMEFPKAVEKMKEAALKFGDNVTTKTSGN